MDERYVAFDVETPNAQNRRMSAIGVCVIEQGQIVQELDTLVDPETHFDPFNVALTGITPEMERGQPTFAALWQLLEPMLAGCILVAHNAPFDLRVLASCLHDYRIDWKPEAAYLCTCQMGRKAYPYLPNHKLNTLCDHLQLSLDHHKAGSGSRACARRLHSYYQKAAGKSSPAKNPRCPPPESMFQNRFYNFTCSRSLLQDAAQIHKSSLYRPIPRRMNSLRGNFLWKLTVLTNACTFS